MIQFTVIVRCLIMLQAHNLRIKLVDPTLPPPKYHTKGSAAFDLYSRVDIDIEPWTLTHIPLNLVASIPSGHFLMISARSSTAMRYGLILANGVGIIDEDYGGDKDEIGINVLNFKGAKVRIHKGDRIAQATLVKISKADGFTVVRKMGSKDRGGWGSTGK